MNREAVAISTEGSFILEDRVYQHKSLVQFSGQTLSAFVDAAANRSGAVVFDQEGTFLTIARNQALWDAMVAEAYGTNQVKK